ncbi:hypothetical protein EDB85DRAFT_1865767, partial [Lactarius pseudohatsudake]
IFHVNGDNTEVVTFVCQLTADYHAKYKKDVDLDIVYYDYLVYYYQGYRYNETNHSSFTWQPRMYQATATHSPDSVHQIPRQVGHFQSGVFSRWRPKA